MRDAGIIDGDLLAVQKAREARNGQIVVARLGDEVTVKRFRRTRTTIELLPENPDFQPIIVPFGDVDFELEGIAVGLVRNNMMRTGMPANCGSLSWRCRNSQPSIFGICRSSTTRSTGPSNASLSSAPWILLASRTTT